MASTLLVFVACTCIQILYANDRFLTQTYGKETTSTNANKALNQGHIQSISWDMCQADDGESAIGRFSWSNSNNVQFIDTECDMIAHCAAISLADDECINGHRVAYDEHHVHWIEFTTSKNNFYSCGDGPDYAADTKLQQYPSHCLTGFGWKADEILNMIQFQYTDKTVLQSMSSKAYVAESSTTLKPDMPQTTKAKDE